MSEDLSRLMRYVDLGECWTWTGHRSWDGYGIFFYQGRPSRAHRVILTILRGPIPHGLQVDHLCRNRACVRLAHLDLVTSRENTMRGQTIAARHAAKTHCDNGHQITNPSQYYVRPTGARSCRKCQLTRTQKYRANKKERAA